MNIKRERDWHNLYKGGWGKELTPEAYCHPAKVARGLARKIYAHAIEQGYLKEGDICLDPFAGIGGFALDAMFHGLHHIGCELEEKFVQLGQQNIDLWNRRYGNGKLRRWGTAVILQGDSRNLVEVLEGARAEGIIASPPFSNSQQVDNRIAPVLIEGSSWKKRQGSITVGTDPAQLGNMPTGEPPAGIVSSPPWHGTTPESGDPDYAHKFHGDQSKYAESTTSLYNELPYMSPKWIERRKEEAKRQGNISRLPAEAVDPDYPTFWSAAKTILLQCYQVLAPGGVAIFVTKRFVRDKAIVEFSQQWADLCQSCGFELVEWIKAWLVEERGTQYDLTGEAHIKTVKRFSFFRRLHARKYPHLAIEWEDILIFRKGKAA